MTDRAMPNQEATPGPEVVTPVRSSNAPARALARNQPVPRKPRRPSGSVSRSPAVRHVFSASPPEHVPAVTIGLPVHNGEAYLAQAIDALRAQTYTDFELIISDNASTDGTEGICREYAALDRRIRYIRQPTNVGAIPNHNLLVAMARGRYFKWASHDDIYCPDLIARCVEVLESRPEVVLAHAWAGVITPDGEISPTPYELDTSRSEPHLRLRSLLRVDGGNDVYGLIRTDVLRQIRPINSYMHSDRTFVGELTLHGQFHQVPERLYLRRDHPDRASRAPRARDVAMVLDPARASRLRQPVVRLYIEYVAGFFSAVRRAPLPLAERLRCLLEVATWLLGRLRPGSAGRVISGRAPSAEVTIPGDRAS